MTVEGFFVWLIFFGIIFIVLALVEGLCKAAAKPVPSPFDDFLNLCVIEGGAIGTPCENCPDLDCCEDEDCPHDWIDWGVE